MDREKSALARQWRRRPLSEEMLVSFNIAAELDTALQTAAQAAGLDPAAFTPEMRAADPRHGDFQANGVLGYAKARKLNPRAVAESVLAALPAALRESLRGQIAGPGFINFKPQARHPPRLGHRL
jgi:arginyl-tRNA synthetase